MVTELTAIKSLIDQAIKPYAEDVSKPSFTVKQLVVMAMIHLNKPVTETCIRDWIVKHFQCWQNLGSSRFYIVSDDQDYEPRAFNYFLRRTLAAVGTPYHSVTKRGGRVLQSCSMPTFTIAVPHAKALLAGVLEHREWKGGAGFFDLAPELRNSIYGMLFLLPNYHVRVEAELQCPTNLEDLSSKEPKDSTKRPPPPRARFIEPASDLFAPLLISRQFYQEAMPIFFQSHAFHFLTPEQMDHSLARLPQSRLKHITHVDITSEPDTCSWNTEGWQRLGQCEGLRKLDLRIDELDWARNARLIKKSGGERDNTLIPGVHDLAKLRGLEEVTFHGCPELEKLLKADMLKPKP